MEDIHRQVAVDEAQTQSCSSCGSTKILTNDEYEQVCQLCGAVLSESFLVTTLTADTGNGIQRTGVIQRNDPNDLNAYNNSLNRFGSINNNILNEYRQRFIRKAKQKLELIASQLDFSSIINEEDNNSDISQIVISKGLQYWKLCYENGYTRGYDRNIMMSVCLYMACRELKQPFLLIDFSAITKINVFKIARVFYKLCKDLHIKLNILDDPTIFIERFINKLNFDSPEISRKIAYTSMKLVLRMKKDWIVTGRRPSGICGACILIACKIHNVNKSINEIINVVKLSESTIKKRINEFLLTPSANLTVNQFNNQDLQSIKNSKYEDNPPIFKKHQRKKNIKFNAKNKNIIFEDKSKSKKLKSKTSKNKNKPKNNKKKDKMKNKKKHSMDGDSSDSSSMSDISSVSDVSSTGILSDSDSDSKNIDKNENVVSDELFNDTTFLSGMDEITVDNHSNSKDNKVTQEMLQHTLTMITKQLDNKHSNVKDQSQSLSYSQLPVVTLDSSDNNNNISNSDINSVIGSVVEGIVQPMTHDDEMNIVNNNNSNFSYNVDSSMNILYSDNSDKIKSNNNNSNKNDIVMMSSNLNDLEDDDEIDHMILDKNEVKIKTKIFNQLNPDYDKYVERQLERRKQEEIREENRRRKRRLEGEENTNNLSDIWFKLSKKSQKMFKNSSLNVNKISQLISDKNSLFNLNYGSHPSDTFDPFNTNPTVVNNNNSNNNNNNINMNNNNIKNELNNLNKLKDENINVGVNDSVSNINPNDLNDNISINFDPMAHLIKENNKIKNSNNSNSSKSNIYYLSEHNLKKSNEMYNNNNNNNNNENYYNQFNGSNSEMISQLLSQNNSNNNNNNNNEYESEEYGEYTQELNDINNSYNNYSNNDYNMI